MSILVMKQEFTREKPVLRNQIVLVHIQIGISNSVARIARHCHTLGKYFKHHTVVNT
jgi:hypothetical protein